MRDTVLKRARGVLFKHQSKKASSSLACQRGAEICDRAKNAGQRRRLAPRTQNPDPSSHRQGRLWEGRAGEKRIGQNISQHHVPPPEEKSQHASWRRLGKGGALGQRASGPLVADRQCAQCVQHRYSVCNQRHPSTIPAASAVATAPTPSSATVSTISSTRQSIDSADWLLGARVHRRLRCD